MMGVDFLLSSSFMLACVMDMHDERHVSECLMHVRLCVCVCVCV